MSNNQIYIKLTTLSNLFIGGSPATFEIGGIDAYTVTDIYGCPYIPASSVKGVLRNIVRDFSRRQHPVANQIKDSYYNYLENMKIKNRGRVEQLNRIVGIVDRLKSMEKRFEDALKELSAEALFGIKGFNQTPKLIFNDLELFNKNQKNVFSIDSKNAIEYQEDSDRPLTANPRTYKTVRPGVVFHGTVMFSGMNQLSLDAEVTRTFVIEAVEQLNSGVYRLGNSGSRGYGRVEVKVVQERVPG